MNIPWELQSFGLQNGTYSVHIPLRSNSPGVILQLWQLPLERPPPRSLLLTQLAQHLPEPWDALLTHDTYLYASQRSETPNLAKSFKKYFTFTNQDFSKKWWDQKMDFPNTIHQPFFGGPKTRSVVIFRSSDDEILSFPNHWIWSDLHHHRRPWVGHMNGYMVSHALIGNLYTTPPLQKTNREANNKNPLENRSNIYFKTQPICGVQVCFRVISRVIPSNL